MWRSKWLTCLFFFFQSGFLRKLLVIFRTKVTIWWCGKYQKTPVLSWASRKQMMTFKHMLISENLARQFSIDLYFVKAFAMFTLFWMQFVLITVWRSWSFSFFFLSDRTVLHISSCHETVDLFYSWVWLFLGLICLSKFTEHSARNLHTRSVTPTQSWAVTGPSPLSLSFSYTHTHTKRRDYINCLITD